MIDVAFRGWKHKSFLFIEEHLKSDNENRLYEKFEVGKNDPFGIRNNCFLIFPIEKYDCKQISPFAFVEKLY